MLLSALRAAPQQWGEITQGAGSAQGMYPQDCATSIDNRRGAVRYADPTNNAAIVAVYDLVGTVGSGAPGGSIVTHGGAPWKSGVQMDVDGTTTGITYRPSDRIEMTNEWGVSIGSGISSLGFNPDETYIEVFDVGSTTPTYFVQFEQNPTLTNYDTDRAGYAHDLAITRDAKWAIVNSENWIHLISLDSTTTTATQLPGINIGGLPAGPCNPDGAVDSVAVTNERAVVTTARLNSTFNTYTTWVYIVDLTASGGPAIVLEHEILPPSNWAPENEQDDERPHDVIITPTRDGGGDFAVVTTNHATAFYRLGSATFVGSDFEGKLNRKYQSQVDSVEASGFAVVTIADLFPASSTTPIWDIRVYHLNAPIVEQPIVIFQDTDATEDGSRAHDLGIDWDFNVAVVRTSVENVIVSNLPASAVTPPPTAPVKMELASSSDAYAYEQYPFIASQRVFSSDSVMIGSEQNGSLYAVTIGARWDGSRFISVADIIDLLATTPAVNSVDINPQNGDEERGCIPLDLAISFDQKDVVVRSTDTFDQSAPNGDGPDLAIITLASGALQRFGGSGTVYGVDSLAAPSLFGYVRTNRRLMSISEDPSPSGLDYTHFVR